MKMSLNQLQIDSYAAQLQAEELTEVKGGTSPACVGIAVGLVGIGVSLFGGGGQTCTTTTTTTSKPDGTVVTKTETKCE